MQKKIIALAVAGLVSGAAFAQSNVTIYGIMDAGVYGWSGNDESSTGVQSSGLSTSRLGFKGEEALGNGLKAIFNLETGINLDDKTSTFKSDRQANVGLTGGFGTVLVGIQPSLSDNWHGGVSETMGNLSSRNIVGLGGRFANEKADGVAYYTPVFSGLQLGVLYGTKNDTDHDNNKTLNAAGVPVAETLDRSAYVQVGGKYANGPFAAALTYAYLNEGDQGDASKEWTVGATYDFSVVKLYAAYERAADVGTARDQTNSMWTLGARVPVTKAGTFSASYSVGKYDVKDTDTKAWQLGYDHNLSKRTTVYAAYMHLANDDAGIARPGSRYGSFSAVTTDVDENYHGFTVGIRHLF